MYRQVKKGHIIYFENYNTERHTGYHFTYEIFDGPRLTYKLKSDFIRLDSGNTWVLSNWNVRRIAEDGTETLKSGKRLDTVFDFEPSEIVPKLFTVEMMNTPELNRFIKAEKLRGSENLNYYLIEKHKRTSWPASTFILVLIGVSVSSRKTRGGLGLNVAIGLGICVSYIFFMQISTTFATLGDFSPLVAVWIPNIVFTFVAAYLYRIAPK